MKFSEGEKICRIFPDSVISYLCQLNILRYNRGGTGPESLLPNQTQAAAENRTGPESHVFPGCFCFSSPDSAEGNSGEGVLYGKHL